MKESIEFEIQRSISKIKNLRKSSQEIQNKLMNLETQLKGINSSLEQEILRVKTLGERGPRTDGKAESPDDLQSKNKFNSQLLKDKLDLLKRVYPEFYKEFEDCCPTSLKDENLDLRDEGY